MKKFFTLFLGVVSFSFAHSQVVISQVYGGGGNTGAQYQNDFVELFNNSTTAVSLAGYSVQYASATGSFSTVVSLTGTINAYGYYLIQFGSNGSIGSPLPAPDATSTTNISATNGKIALSTSTTNLGTACNTSATVIDYVGYGTANCPVVANGGTAPAGSNTTAIKRMGDGSVNSGSNTADFTTGAPGPRNVILPLQLLSFSAAPQGNSLLFSWKTAAEHNTSHFDVEQSSDGIAFKAIATVAATGNSTIEKSYSYTGTLTKTTAYYRLKMVDADGKFTTSSVVKFSPVVNGFSLGNVYPVPAKNSVTIEWNSNRAGAATATLTDVSGRTIRTVATQSVQGFNRLLLDVQSLTAGQYFLRLQGDANQVQTIITKQ